MTQIPKLIEGLNHTNFGTTLTSILEKSTLEVCYTHIVIVRSCDVSSASVGKVFVRDEGIS